MSLNVLTTSVQNAQSIRDLINKIDGQDIITIFSSNISPKNLQIYKYDLTNNQTFTFTDQTKTVLFRLYLTMPSEIYQVNFSSNVEWENNEKPTLNEANTLYMFVFEWSTELNKWLGNLMWESSYTANNSSQSNMSANSINVNNSNQQQQITSSESYISESSINNE